MRQCCQCFNSIMLHSWCCFHAAVIKKHHPFWGHGYFSVLTQAWKWSCTYFMTLQTCWKFWISESWFYSVNFWRSFTCCWSPWHTFCKYINSTSANWQASPPHRFTFPLWNWVLWCSTWRSLASGSTFYYGPWWPLQCSLCWWVGRCCDPGSSPWHIWHPRWNPSPGDPVPSPNLQLRGFGHFAKGAGSSPQESGLVSVIFGICPGSLGSPFSQACNPPKL